MSVAGELRARYSEYCSGFSVHSGVDAVPIREMGGGFGVVASQELNSFTQLAVVPEGMMLNGRVARGLLCHLVNEEFSRYLENEPPLTSIVTSLLLLRSPEAQRTLTELEVDAHAPAAHRGASTPASGSSPLDLHDFADARQRYTLLSPWIRSLPARYDNLLEVPLNAILMASSEAPATDRLPQRYYEKILQEQTRMDNTRIGILSKLQHFVKLEAKRVSTSDGSVASRLPAELLSRIANEVICALSDPVSFCWAYNSLMSRGFSYTPRRVGGGPTKNAASKKSQSALASTACVNDGVWTMMPWVDYINYSTSPNITLSVCPNSGQYKFLTLRPIAKGEQLLFKYGDYTDFELLVWYGFTLCSGLPSGDHASGEQVEEDEEIGDETPEQKSVATSPTSSRPKIPTDRAHHQEFCGYCFSPLADPDGEYPEGSSWLIDLLERCTSSSPSTNTTNSAHADLVSFCFSDEAQRKRFVDEVRKEFIRAVVESEGSDDLRDCRITRKSGFSKDFARALKLLHRVVTGVLSKVDLTPSKPTLPDLTRQLIRSELGRCCSASSAVTASSGLVTDYSPIESQLRGLRVLQADSASVLKHFVELSDTVISKLLSMAK